VTVTVLLHRDTIIERTGCPVCHAEAGRACWSRLLQRAMRNEVHRERRTLAATRRPVKL